MSIKDKLLAFIREEEGLTTVEYAVAGAMIAATVVAAFGLLGDEVEEAIGEITTAQSRIVDWHERWTPEQRRELAAALTLARRDLHVEPSKLEVVR